MNELTKKYKLKDLCSNPITEELKLIYERSYLNLKPTHAQKRSVSLTNPLVSALPSE